MVMAGNERHTLAGRRPSHPADERPAPTVMATEAKISIMNVDERFDVERPAPMVRTGPDKGDYWQARIVHEKGSSAGIVRSIDDPAPCVMAHGIDNNKHSSVMLEVPAGARDGASIEGTAIGREWDGMEEGEQSGRYFNLIRPDRDAPSPTILASHGERGIAGVTHPIEKRKFSIAELRRICSFPDDFVLTGSYAQQWERLGRAVPPLMMRAIAETVRDKILIPHREARDARGKEY
jgi:DNA (cytosine-5)-methyltransferase 1